MNNITLLRDASFLRELLNNCYSLPSKMELLLESAISKAFFLRYLLNLAILLSSSNLISVNDLNDPPGHGSPDWSDDDSV